MATSLNVSKMLLGKPLHCLRRLESSVRSFSSSNSCRCKDESPSKTADQQTSPESKPKFNKEEAKLKLNQLLESLSQPDPVATNSSRKLNLTVAKPKETKKKTPAVDFKIEPKMLKAVENVAETFPQRKEETRRNLLNQLKALTVESDARKLQAIDLKPAAPEAKQEQSGMLSSYLEAVKEEPSKKKNVETKAKPQPLPPVPTHDPAALQSILGSLKVESTAKAQDPEFPFKRNERNERNLYDGNRSNVGSGFKLNGEKPFGIFEGAKFEDAESTPALSTWRKLYQRELELAVSHPPQNGFEQMIMWTRQGKLWQFPINNEQGLEEEAKVGFHEHIFMERHLEPWCPKRGPIRHFMELVCVGLSKNPYLTVAEKKEHILWFKNYFTDKRSLLAETGAIDTSPLNQLNV